MDLEIIILSETSQTEKDKYLMIWLISAILKKMIQIYSFTKQKDLQTYRRKEAGKCRGEE